MLLTALYSSGLLFMVVGLDKPSVPSAPRKAERISLAEAKVLVCDWVRTESRGERNLQTIPLKELTTPAIWDKLGVQVFKEDLPRSVTSQDTFVVKQRQVYRIGRSYGGDGVTSLCVADLRRNGRPLLVYSYTCGMSLHANCIDMFDCLADKPSPMGTGLCRLHAPDWTVTSADDHTVRVNMGKMVLGDLVLEEKDGKSSARVQLRGDVPEEIRRQFR